MYRAVPYYPITYFTDASKTKVHRYIYVLHISKVT